MNATTHMNATTPARGGDEQLPGDKDDLGAVPLEGSGFEDQQPDTGESEA